MIGEPYPFSTKAYMPERDSMFFTFWSNGKNGAIPKAILYAPIKKNDNIYYNVGFGDITIDPVSGTLTLDDKKESNNGDVVMILYTVVSSISLFFDYHPKGTIHLTGSNRQRMEIYQKLIARHWNDIKSNYVVRGSRGEIDEDFQTGVLYAYILISQRKFLYL